MMSELVPSVGLLNGKKPKKRQKLKAADFQLVLLKALPVWAVCAAPSLGTPFPTLSPGCAPGQGSSASQEKEQQHWGCFSWNSSTFLRGLAPAWLSG